MCCFESYYILLTHVHNIYKCILKARFKLYGNCVEWKFVGFHEL